MIRRPPRPTRTDTLFHYTTLFRSLVADGVVVGGAHAHRDVLAPVVLDPLDDLEAAGLKILHAVGAAAERRLQGGRREVAAFPVVLRQHRKLPPDERQLAVLSRLESELHAALVQLLHVGHSLAVAAARRTAFPDRG